MGFIRSYFMGGVMGDGGKVIGDGCVNLGFIGKFGE